MIRVWSDGKSAGALDKRDEHGSTFAYTPGAPSTRAISLTMPVRLESWDTNFGLAPIFEMNLPEGALRDRLRRMFAKVTGTFDDFDLLEIVGRTQIGRVRYSGENQSLEENVPQQSIDDILHARKDGDLFEYLLNRFAQHSGLSGVQPKFMIRASGKPSEDKGRQSPTIMSATHIVKLWDEDEYPELAANEFFCLTAAKKLGLTVPPFILSDDGGALVIERFDLRDQRYLGFEDFCVLNAVGTRDKYDGGYETRVFKRLKEFVAPKHASKSLEELFKLFVLNCAIRNGDAHLKNFGLVYDDVDGDPALAPVYDIVTTTAYIPVDTMALTLDGTKRWPDRKRLSTLGQIRAGLSAQKIDEIIESIADALSDTAPEMALYFKSSEFDVGQRIEAAWAIGIRETLGVMRGLTPVNKQPERQTKAKRAIAGSESRLLELLRQKGGTITGTQRSIANLLQMPPSTLSTAIKRLVERGLLVSGVRKITLVASREV